VIYRPRYNLAPGDQHWIVIMGTLKGSPNPPATDSAGRSPASSTRSPEKGAGRVIVPAQWGFPTSEGSRLLINARYETAAKRPAFRDAYRGRRCIVPADGFYEWRHAEPKKRGEPFWYHYPDGKLLLMAGVFTADEKPAFTILTMPANEIVSPAHDRMPVVLSPEGARRWLEDPRFDLRGRTAELGRDLVATPVSTRVNSTANDDPACLDPPGSEPERPDPQLRLID